MRAHGEGKCRPHGVGLMGDLHKAWLALMDAQKLGQKKNSLVLTPNRTFQICASLPTLWLVGNWTWLTLSIFVCIILYALYVFPALLNLLYVFRAIKSVHVYTYKIHILTGQGFHICT